MLQDASWNLGRKFEMDGKVLFGKHPPPLSSSQEAPRGGDNCYASIVHEVHAVRLLIKTGLPEWVDFTKSPEDFLQHRALYEPALDENLHEDDGLPTHRSYST